ncbi:MAG: ABC transporter permease [Coriobacteriales bacterium]|jgi:NitT/TauT family transport system permease protein|nr:ABC transporter permease [Coriobacteriales bacterium]
MVKQTPVIGIMRSVRKRHPLRGALLRLAGYIISLLAILAGWQLLSIIVHSPALPAPIDSIQMLIRHAPQIVPHLGTSLYRVVVSMALGTIAAVPLGLAIGRSPRLDTMFAPFLYILYPIPKIVLLPVLLVLLGLADAPKIVLITITIFFQVLVTVRDSAKAVPDASILSVRSLGASRWQVYRHVVVPACMPELFTALRISSGTAVAILFFAEAIAGSTGLGYFIMDSWGMIAYSRMFAGIIAMALMGVLLYEAIDAIERHVTRWRA